MHPNLIFLCVCGGGGGGRGEGARVSELSCKESKSIFFAGGGGGGGVGWWGWWGGVDGQTDEQVQTNLPLQLFRR